MSKRWCCHIYSVSAESKSSGIHNVWITEKYPLLASHVHTKPWLNTTACSPLCKHSVIPLFRPWYHQYTMSALIHFPNHMINKNCTSWLTCCNDIVYHDFSAVWLVIIFFHLYLPISLQNQNRIYEKVGNTLVYGPILTMLNSMYIIINTLAVY